MQTPVNDIVTLTNHRMTFGRPYYKLSKYAIRLALALLGAKLWTFKLWPSKSAVSLPLPLAWSQPLLPGATYGGSRE